MHNQVEEEDGGGFPIHDGNMRWRPRPPDAGGNAGAGATPASARAFCSCAMASRRRSLSSICRTSASRCNIRERSSARSFSRCA
jgi:hypothetical protein